MANDSRYLHTALVNDPLADGKMAFLSGPRQCGKTTLAELLLAESGCTENYFSWDNDVFKRLWIKDSKSLLGQIEQKAGSPIPLIVLDELHKYKNWKNSLKGFYDLHKRQVRLLITGSARLNIYRKSGDSLAGRYIPYRLHPFSFAEGAVISPPPIGEWISPLENRTPRFPLQDLLRLGGFPEPLLKGDGDWADRWWRLYREQLVREDLRDLKAIRDLQHVSTLVTLLLDKVGGGFSFQSLQEDLSLSFSTVRDWISALESIFLCFLIRPYSKRIQNSLKKEPKIYFFNWAAIQESGPRLENLVACHLLKSIQAWTDSALGEFELHYIRDKYKREVDFCITQGGRPWLLVEVKNSTKALSPSLLYYTEYLNPEFSIQLQPKGAPRRLQLTAKGQKIWFIAIDEFLLALN